MSPRFLIVAPIAVVITAALFFLMRDLIATTPEKPEAVPSEKIELTRKEPEDPPEPDIDPKPPLDEPEKPPPTMDHDAVRDGMDIDTNMGDPDKPGIPTGGAGVGPIFQHLDGSATPIIRGKPPYPTCGRGTGDVVLDFVVEPDGSISDVRVVKASSSCFARAARRAALRWRYKPEVVDGKAVRSGRQRVRMQFIEED